MDEYFAHLERPGTPLKTFRIKVFAFPAAEDPLTPDEILDGETFFRCAICSLVFQKLLLARHSSALFYLPCL